MSDLLDMPDIPEVVIQAVSFRLMELVPNPDDRVKIAENYDADYTIGTLNGLDPLHASEYAWEKFNASLVALGYDTEPETSDAN